MVHIEIIEPEANAGETGSMTTSTSSGVLPNNIGTSKPDGIAEAETNNDDDIPLVRLARVVKVSIQTGFVDSAMLLNLEKAYNPPPSAGADAEAERNTIAAQASASAIIGPSNNNTVGTANDGDTKIFFREDMWETLARRAWPKCGDMFLTEISKMTTYRDLFVKGLTSDGRNGGWFEKVSADIGGGRAALEYYASHCHLFDEILREDAGDDAADTIEVVLAALTYLKELEYPQRHDDEDDDGEDDESVNEEDDHYSRAIITLDALPKLVGLLKSAAVPASVQGGALDLLCRIVFVEDVVSSGAIQPTVNLLGSSDDPLVQYCGLDLLYCMAANEPNYCSELFRAGVVEAMVSYVERKKSSIWNQASPAEGLLLPDDGDWKGRRILRRWSRLLAELTSQLPSSEVMDMEAVIPCLTSLIGEPIFYLSDRGSLGAAVDSMFESVLNLCRSTEDKIRNAFVGAGILTTSFALLNEGLDDGISQKRLAATLLILRYCFTAPGRESYSQAIVDAGFFDIAIALLGGGHGENVMVATCRVLLDLAESNLEPFSADVCMTIARVAVEADGNAEVELTLFFYEFLVSLADKRLTPLEGPLLGVMRYLIWGRTQDLRDIDDLVVNLIEKGFVELLLTKLQSTNDSTVVCSTGSICLIMQLYSIKDGTATGRMCLSLMSQVAMPLLSVMERNEGNKGIQESSLILKQFHSDCSLSGRFKRFFLGTATPFALVFMLAWCALGLMELVMGTFASRLK